jgi:hypothetical protein
MPSHYPLRAARSLCRKLWWGLGTGSHMCEAETGKKTASRFNLGLGEIGGGWRWWGGCAGLGKSDLFWCVGKQFAGDSSFRVAFVLPGANVCGVCLWGNGGSVREACRHDSISSRNGSNRGTSVGSVSRASCFGVCVCGVCVCSTPRI